MAIENTRLKVEDATWAEIERACDGITNTYGLVAVTLELALNKKDEDSSKAIKSAIGLSIQGNRVMKRLLWLMQMVREASKERGEFIFDPDSLRAADSQSGS